jgi:hypothetical protein
MKKAPPPYAYARAGNLQMFPKPTAVVVSRKDNFEHQ